VTPFHHLSGDSHLHRSLGAGPITASNHSFEGSSGSSLASTFSTRLLRARSVWAALYSGLLRILRSHSLHRAANPFTKARVRQYASSAFHWPHRAHRTCIVASNGGLHSFAGNEQ